MDPYVFRRRSTTSTQEESYDGGRHGAAAPGHPAARAAQGVRRHPPSWRSTASTSTSPTASSSRCSARPGSGKTTVLRMIAGFEEPTAGTVELGRQRRHPPPAVRARRQHGLPGLRAVPAHERAQNVEYGLRVKKVAAGRAASPGRRGARAVRLGDYGDRAPRPAVRRPAPARRPGPRPGQPAAGAAARRAARRPRPQAARADAGRAQGDPARRRHHVRVRHPRPGGGADDSDRIAVFNAGRIEQVGTAARGLRAARRPSSSRASSAPRTCCAATAARRRRSARDGTFSVRPEKIRARRPAARAAARRAVARRAPSPRSSTSAPVTRYVVDLDGGRRLVALQQNGTGDAAEAVGRAAPRSQLAWRPEPRHRRPVVRPTLPQPTAGNPPKEGARRAYAPTHCASAPSRPSPRSPSPAAATVGDGGGDAPGAGGFQAARPQGWTSSGRARARSTSSRGPATPRTAATTRASTGSPFEKETGCQVNVKIFGTSDEAVQLCRPASTTSSPHPATRRCA